MVKCCICGYSYDWQELEFGVCDECREHQKSLKKKRQTERFIANLILDGERLEAEDDC